jgi:soluble lytic murein transglycosylase-like protein
MSIESIQARIYDIQSRIAAITERAEGTATQPTQGAPFLPEGAVQNPDMITESGASKPFDVLVAQRLGDVRLQQKPSGLAGLLSGSPAEIDSLVQKYAGQFGVDPNLVRAVISSESGGKVDAKSSAGALGLMQLMPATAKRYGADNPFDAEQNISAGTKYLAEMLKGQNGNVELALAAYNAGPGAVAKFKGIPPFDETRGYVSKTMREFRQLSGR